MSKSDGAFGVFFMMGLALTILGFTTEMTFIFVGITFMIFGMVGFAHSRSKAKGGPEV